MFMHFNNRQLIIIVALLILQFLTPTVILTSILFLFFNYSFFSLFLMILIIKILQKVLNKIVLYKYNKYKEFLNF